MLRGESCDSSDEEDSDSDSDNSDVDGENDEEENNGDYGGSEYEKNGIRHSSI